MEKVLICLVLCMFFSLFANANECRRYLAKALPNYDFKNEIEYEMDISIRNILPQHANIEINKLFTEFRYPEFSQELSKYYLIDISTESNWKINEYILEYVKSNNYFEWMICDSANTDLYAIPDDTYFNEQWGMQNTGQKIEAIYGYAGVDINPMLAWNYTKGNPNIKIGVIDSGIPNNDVRDLEFANRIIPCYDYIKKDGLLVDNDGHGSTICGIIGAIGDNAIGVAGVNWISPIMAFKCAEEDKFISSDAIKAIKAVSDSGVNVVNMSFGTYAKVFDDVVDYAYKAGVICVAAIGNDAKSKPMYPAACDHVISVGALNNSGRRVKKFIHSPEQGSNYGNHLDFMAPGESIICLNAQNINNNLTTYKGGTSQAAPFVTGTISLMLSIDSTLTFEQIYEILKITAKDQTGDPNEDTPGFDMYHGWGLIDAGKAVEYVHNNKILNVKEFNDRPNICVPILSIDGIVRITEKDTEEEKIHIHNLIGEEISTKLYRVRIDELGTLLDLTQLKNGTYLLSTGSKNYLINILI